jgi:hypothetical protein
MHPEFIIVLNSLSDTGYSVSSLIVDILGAQIHDLDRLLVLQTAKDQLCHGSAGTPLGTHAIGQDSGLEESHEAIRT